MAEVSAETGAVRARLAEELGSVRRCWSGVAKMQVRRAGLFNFFLLATGLAMQSVTLAGTEFYNASAPRLAPGRPFSYFADVNYQDQEAGHILFDDVTVPATMPNTLFNV